MITIFFSDHYKGALTSPKQNGSAYVLLHHVMGEAAGKKGVWAYVEGKLIKSSSISPNVLLSYTLTHVA